jgi:autotransporter-associated beta strand protein
VQDQCRTRIAGVITGHGDGGHLCTLHAISRWPGCLEIGPEDERTNMIGRLRVEGHLRHVAGTTLITSNTTQTGVEAPLYITGDDASYKSNRGVFEVAGGTVKVTRYCRMDIRQYGQVIVTNGLLDAWNTAEYLNAHPSPARLIVGGNGTMTCRLLRISQCARRDANGEPRAEVSVTTGGVLKLEKFRADPVNAPNSCGILNLDGGVVVSQRNEENFLGESGTPAHETTWQSNILVRAGAGGAIIDTEDYTVTVKAPLRSGAAADGGLVKRGAGTLIMASTNSYNGATRVEGGQLVFTHVDGLPSGALEFSAGAVASEDKTTPHLVAKFLGGQHRAPHRRRQPPRHVHRGEDTGHVHRAADRHARA